MSDDDTSRELFQRLRRERQGGPYLELLIELGDRPDCAEALAPVLREGDEGERLLALAALQRAAHRCPREVASALEGGMGASSAVVRQRVAEVLGATRSERAAAPLRALLGDPDPRVRAEAAISLGSMRPREAAPVALALMASPDRPERLLGLGVVPFVYEEALVTAVLGLTGAASADERAAALKALGTLRSEVAPELLALLRQGKLAPEAQVAAVGCLQRNEIPVPPEVVAAMVAGDSPSLQHAGIRLSEEIGGTGSCASLLALADRGATPSVRASALRAAHRLGCPGAASLEDPGERASLASRAREHASPLARAEALRALVGREDAAKVLLAAASDDPADLVRAVAIEGLGAGGGDEAVVAAVLRAALQEVDEELLLATLGAIRRRRAAGLVEEVAALWESRPNERLAASALACLGVLDPARFTGVLVPGGAPIYDPTGSGGGWAVWVRRPTSPDACRRLFFTCDGQGRACRAPEDLDEGAPFAWEIRGHHLRVTPGGAPAWESAFATTPTRWRHPVTLRRRDVHLLQLARDRFFGDRHPSASRYFQGIREP